MVAKNTMSNEKAEVNQKRFYLWVGLCLGFNKRAKSSKKIILPTTKTERNGTCN